MNDDLPFTHKIKITLILYGLIMMHTMYRSPHVAVIDTKNDDPF